MARQGVRLSDAQWAKIEPHLPRVPRSPRGGRPWVDHRAVIDGILWVLKTGARWRDCRASIRVPRPVGVG
jgi:transposase